MQVPLREGRLTLVNLKCSDVCRTHISSAQDWAFLDVTVPITLLDSWKTHSPQNLRWCSAQHWGLGSIYQHIIEKRHLKVAEGMFSDACPKITVEKHGCHHPDRKSPVLLCVRVTARCCWRTPWSSTKHWPCRQFPFQWVEAQRDKLGDMSQAGIYVPGENYTFVTGTFIVTCRGSYWGCIKNRVSLFYGW